MVGDLSVGLIPAHAGKTLQRSARHDHQRAHPRSRGENGPVLIPRQATPGSSPLTRGKLDDGQAHQARARLIPAHAGKTHP